MTPNLRNLGKLLSTHRPPIFQIWVWSFLVMVMLMPFLFGLVFTLDWFTSVVTQNPKSSSDGVPGALICLGVSGLLLAVFVSFWVSDFRKWKATKTVKLKIYEKGLPYESAGQSEACYWNEIFDVTHRMIEIIPSRHAAPKKINFENSLFSDYPAAS